MTSFISLNQNTIQYKKAVLSDNGLRQSWSMRHLVVWQVNTETRYLCNWLDWATERSENISIHYLHTETQGCLVTSNVELGSTLFEYHLHHSAFQSHQFLVHPRLILNVIISKLPAHLYSLAKSSTIFSCFLWIANFDFGSSWSVVNGYLGPPKKNNILTDIET